MVDINDKCIYPNCKGNVKNGKSMYNLCVKHTELLKFFLWALNNVTLNNKDDASKEVE